MNADMARLQAEALFWAAEQAPDPIQADRLRREGEYLMTQAREEASG